MSKDLIYYQVRGFGFAFIAILISICLIFRSWKMGFLASFPNILPILIVYGVMGFARIELSSPTAMIASVVIGMVVDASVHFLYRFRREFSRRQSHHIYSMSLHRTYRRIGQSLSGSTMILVIGFSSSIFASFRPTIYFGLLTSLAILCSFISTMVVLPVLIVIFKPFGRDRHSSTV